jgi:hypothetical protein
VRGVQRGSKTDWIAWFVGLAYPCYMAGRIVGGGEALIIGLVWAALWGVIWGVPWHKKGE